MDVELETGKLKGVTSSLLLLIEDVNTPYSNPRHRSTHTQNTLTLKAHIYMTCWHRIYVATGIANMLILLLCFNSCEGVSCVSFSGSEYSDDGKYCRWGDADFVNRIIVSVYSQLNTH